MTLPQSEKSFQLPAFMKGREHFLIAIGIFIFGGFLLSALCIHIDDTNFGTANGLWKSVMLRDYMSIPDFVDYQNPHEYSFVSNLLYFPVYAFLIKLMPGFLADMEVFQQISIINCWFGAFALASMFMILFRLFKKTWVAFAGMLFQLSGGIFLSVSLGSEDIIPAYAVYLVAVYFLLAYLQTGNVADILIAGFAFAISWMFHWTMAIGPTLPFALAIILKQWNFKKVLLHGIYFATVNLGLIAIMMLAFDADVMQILLPGKMGSSGSTLGFNVDKFILLFTGFLQSIIGGFQFNSLSQFIDVLTRSDWYSYSFVASVIILTALTFFCVRYFIHHRKEKVTLQFGIFMLGVFLIAQAMNAYEFGTDLQFHIQPMAWLPIGFACFCIWLNELNFWNKEFFKKNRKYLIPVIVFLIPISITTYNLYKYRLQDRQGLDSKYISGTKEVSDSIDDRSKLYFVTRGWDEFGNWAYVLWGQSYREQSITLVQFLFDEPMEPIEEAEKRLGALITYAINNGKSVIIGPDIFGMEADRIVNFFSGFDQDAKMQALIEVVKTRFEKQVYLDSELGKFYQLLPKTRETEIGQGILL